MREYNFSAAGSVYSFRLGCSSLFDDRAVRWIAAMSLRSPPLGRPKFLTTAAFSRVARPACGGFRRPHTTATTFHIFHRRQITNFGLLKSAPNGLNYMDVRRSFLHDRFRT